MTPQLSFQWPNVYRAVKNLYAVTRRSHFYDFQAEIVQALTKAVVNEQPDEYAVIISRQAGKTEAVAAFCYGMMVLGPDLFPDRFSNGFRVGLFAPTYDLSRIIYDRLRDLFVPEIMDTVDLNVTSSNGNTHGVSNGSFARCLTANPDTAKEGHTFDLIIGDEAQDIETKVLLKSIWPMGTATGAPKVLIGTPNTKRNYFYDLIQRLKGTDKVYQFDVDRVINDRRKMYDKTGKKWHLLYQKDFEQQLRLRGRDDYINMAYYLTWMAERGMFITEDRLWDTGLPYDRTRKFEHEVYAGLDLGKESDRTVLTIETMHSPNRMTVLRSDGERVVVEPGEMLWDDSVQRYHTFVLDWLTFEGDRYTDQVPAIADYIRRGYPNCRNLSFDETGVGLAVKDLLYESSLSEMANGFSFGTSGQVLSDLWESLQRVMPNKAIRHFPLGSKWTGQPMRDWGHTFDNDTRNYVSEFTNLEKEWRGLLLKCMVPEGRSVHDDYCASSALSNYGIHHYSGMRIGVAPESYDPKTGVSSGRLSVDGIFKDSDDIGGDGAYYL